MYSVDIAKSVEEFVNGLPAVERCSEEEHARRLDICNACSECQNGICSKCGCFVVARSAKIGMYCPLPGNQKW